MASKQFWVLSFVICMLLTCGVSLSKAIEAGLPAADGQAVYEYITVTSPYQKWDRYPGKGEFYPSDYHSKFMTSYVSSNTLDAIKSKTGPLPDGSFIVSEAFKGNKTSAGIVVMYRVEGYNPEAGDWFWARYANDGKVKSEGKVELCIDCHTKVKNRDWLYGRTIK